MNNINNDNNDNIKECIICFEKPKSIFNKLIKLKDQSIYKTNCICNPYLHNECLQKWININNKCPICREYIIIKKNRYLIIINYLACLSIIIYNIVIFLFLFYYLHFIILS